MKEILNGMECTGAAGSESTQVVDPRSRSLEDAGGRLSPLSMCVVLFCLSVQLRQLLLHSGRRNVQQQLGFGKEEQKSSGAIARRGTLNTLLGISNFTFVLRGLVSSSWCFHTILDSALPLHCVAACDRAEVLRRLKCSGVGFRSGASNCTLSVVSKMATTCSTVSSPNYFSSASLDGYSRSNVGRNKVLQGVHVPSQCGEHSVRGLMLDIGQSAKSALAGNRKVSRSHEGMRKLRIMAAAPPGEEVAVRAEPLTKQDLVAYLASGCKPKEKWRIGTEHEKFGFQLDTLKPMTYEQISKLLQGMSERFDWERVMEGNNIIGLKFDGQSVSLEPGGQFELSGAPLDTLHQTCAEVNSHLYQVKAVAEELGLGFAGIGFQPKWPVDSIPIMPKGRYDIMRNYMPRVGKYGLDMMFRTCTVQVNLDFESEEDMAKKFRVGLALQPIATALFANSPFTEGKPNDFLSFRSHIWTDVDNNRTGDLPFVFQDDFGFEKYVDYALDVPMYFAYRNHRYVDCSGLSFRDFLAGKLPVLPGETPTLTDWENHLTTIFPEVRLKRYLEMRGADGGPWRRLCALPAFWVGLLYDEQSLQGALDIISDWTDRERAMLRLKVPKQGLQVPFRDGMLKHVAQDIYQLAKDGLIRRGFNEVGFLNEIEETVRTGVTPAERLLKLYNEKWGQNIDPIFQELLY